MSNKASDLREAKERLERSRHIDHDSESDTIAEAKLLLEIREIEAEEAAEREIPRLETEEQEYESSPRKRAWEHEDRARDVAAVRKKLQNSQVGHAQAAAGLVRGREDSRLSESDFQSFRKQTNATVSEGVLDRELAELEKRERKAAKRLEVKEPRVYGKDSPNSWFVDTALAGSDDVLNPKADEARARQDRYGVEVGYEIARRSKEGKYAERVLRERRRTENEDVHRRGFQEELRAIGTGGGVTASGSNGAVFVSPYFLIQDWAPFRGIYRSFADQCHEWPLPEWGMKVYIPSFSSAASATQQVEGSAVSESSPSTALESAEIKNVSGEVIISQQLHERGFQGSGSFDAVIYRQIRQQIDEAVESYVLNQVITNGAAVSGGTTYKPGKLYQDIALGREKLTDTAGTRLRPTHFFTTSDLYSYATRYSIESEEKTIIEARFVPGFPLAQNVDDGAQGDKERPKWSRFTGTVLPGGLLWFTSDAIPVVGTTTKTQLLVSAPEQSVALCEGDPILTVFSETLANDLQCVVNAREYLAAVTRYASGTAVITGEAYKTSQI